MHKTLQGFCDKEVELDVYLPGTPHAVTKMYDLFPYHIWGKGTNLAAINEANERKSELRRREVVRRRHKPSCFEEACAYGNLQTVMLWWGQEAVDVPSRRALYEGSDASGLMWACYRGHLPIVRFLVDRGAPIMYENSRGHTALKWAVIGGSLDVVRYLLDHGADPAFRDKQGHDAAFTAVQRCNLAALMMLSEDALEARAVVLRSTEELAAAAYADEGQPRQGASLAVVQVVNATLVNPVTNKPYFILDTARRDVSGQTLVHWAAYTNRPSVVQYLVEYWGSDVDATDKYGRTPLIWAAREGFAEVTEYLLQSGADASITDADGLTAQKYAIMRNHPEAATVLESMAKHRAKTRRQRTPRPAAAASEDAAEEMRSHAAREGASSAVPVEDDDSKNQATVQTTLITPSTSLAKRHSWLGFLVSYVRKVLGFEYWTVRERRAASTFILIFTDRIFALLAILSVVFMIATIVFTRAMPPFMGCFPFAAYFFKNMVTTLIVGHPEQGSVDQPMTIVARTGLPMSFAQSVKGTWRTRSRDPANMLAVIFFIIFQAYCWAMMGNKSFLFFTKMYPGHPTTHFSAEYLSARTLTRKRAFSSYVGGSLLALSGDTNAEFCISDVLCFLFWAVLVSAALCKFTSRLSVIPRDQEGQLSRSPIWRVLRTRCYKWLHPRLYLGERHMQIPVRAFYCPELDVVVRRYDGYSILMDCPIGEVNHVFFVLFVTFFFLYEVLLLVWGYTQIRLNMTAPVGGVDYYTCRGTPFYMNAFLPLGSTQSLQTAFDTNKMVHNYVNITSRQQLDAIDARPEVSVSVLSLAWLNDALRVILHGLPCPHVAYQHELLGKYLSGPKTWMHYALFLFFYYVWPSQVQTYGVWVLQFSVIAAGMLAVILYRQYRAIVFRGATCMELANPLAAGSNGDLVLIFPPDIRESSVMLPHDVDEEFFYELTDPSRACTEADLFPGSQCIFGARLFFVNALRFFSFRQGREWKGAMSVTAHNRPNKNAMLSS